MLSTFVYMCCLLLGLFSTLTYLCYLPTGCFLRWFICTTCHHGCFLSWLIFATCLPLVTYLCYLPQRMLSVSTYLKMFEEGLFEVAIFMSIFLLLEPTMKQKPVAELKEFRSYMHSDRLLIGYMVISTSQLQFHAILHGNECIWFLCTIC